MDYPVWSLTSLPNLASLTVGENAWPCDCITVRNIQSINYVLSDSTVTCTTLSGKTVSISSMSNLTLCTETPVSQTVADIHNPGGGKSLALPITVCLVTA